MRFVLIASAVCLAAGLQASSPRSGLSRVAVARAEASVPVDAGLGSPAAGPVPAGLDERLFGLNKVIIDSVKGIIDVVYNNNDFARFYVLETVARVPYFAYLSVLHLRETFGAREANQAARMRTHYAEADNELHHLLIMESLGGNSSAVDRTVAQTMAFFYYWYVVGVYSVSEQAAYHLSELIEDHAYETYDKFVKVEGERLKMMPVPDIARQYYERDDPFLFDSFCTVREEGTLPRNGAPRPKLESLYDVFVSVRNDEKEHWKTLCNLVQYDSTEAMGNPIANTLPAPVPAAK